MRFLPIVFFLLFSCHQSPNATVKSTNTKAIKDSSYTILYGDTSLVDTSLIDEFELLYIVVADTSLNYNILKKKASLYASKNNEKFEPIDVNTVLFNLPKDSDAHEYGKINYLRKSAEEYLSIEYLFNYYMLSTKKLMAIVVGIYKTPEEANNRLKKIKKHFPNAFYFKSLL